jgi:RPA family protein
MPEEQFKRNVAYKFRIGELIRGKAIFDQEKFSFLELGNKKVVRVNLVGNIVDKYESEGEKNYVFFTLDDGSGQIKIRAFGENTPKFKKFNQGDTIIVIGTLRNFNNETYVLPEIMKEEAAKYLLLRKLELEKQRNENTSLEIKPNETKALKDQLLEKIKASEEEGGIDVDRLILDLNDSTPERINQEIKKLLEEGIIFEPRPGRVRYLG